MEIAYYPGCSLKASSELYDEQSKRVFSELGIELKELEDWNCCGATSVGKVDDFLSVAMPARNLGIADNTDYEEMVIPCSACYSRTLVAQQRLKDNPELMETINSELSKKITNRIKVSSILEVLLKTVESGELKKKAVKKLKGLTPVCYYGCMLTRFPYTVPVPDDVENPQGMEKVLKVLGIKALDWNMKTYCCGASAAINDTETSLNLMAKIMNDALARGADSFVTTCPMCQLNLDAYQDQFCKKHGIRERLPVYFITELVGAALDISPSSLQLDRHFVDGIGLLKEKEQS